MKNTHNDTEKAFLAEINKSVPKDVDWKKGAVDYIKNFVLGHGRHAKWFHYSIPFGENHAVSIIVLNNFLNTLQLLNLPPKSSFLDVGCGSGWIPHLLAKFDYSATGIDISSELIEIAKERVRDDKYTPFEGVPFSANYLVHDIEEGPVNSRSLYDAAILESSLHHFYDPVSALKNVRKTLKKDGVVVILEGVLPPSGTKEHDDLKKCMKEFNTLERAYTREQMEKLLKLTGFEHYKFYYPINGFFEQDRDNSGLTELFALKKAGLNNVVASADAGVIKRLSLQKSGKLSFNNFYNEEKDSVHTFRWSKPASSIELNSVRELTLKIYSFFPAFAGKPQEIYVYRDGALAEKITLKSKKEQILKLTDLEKCGTISFHSDSVFCPKCYGISHDDRSLSFVTEILDVK